MRSIIKKVSGPSSPSASVMALTLAAMIVSAGAFSTVRALDGQYSVHAVIPLKPSQIPSEHTPGAAAVHRLSLASFPAQETYRTSKRAEYRNAMPNVQQSCVAAEVSLAWLNRGRASARIGR